MKADRLIKRIYARKYHVVNTCVVGVNQSGKTALNFFIMERLHELGLGDAFGSNTPLKADFPVDFIEDYQTLKQRCQMLNPDPERFGLKRYVFNWGEMGKSVAKDMSWENTKFVKEMQVLRKLGLCILGDGIDRIDGRIFSPSHFHGYFEKQSKNHPEKAVYIDWTKKGKPTRINGIPMTNIKYNQWYTAMFLWDSPTPEAMGVFLNPEHEIVRKYLEAGSIKKTGLSSEEVKRARDKVLAYHMSHCLKVLEKEEETESSEPLKSDIAKDTLEVTK